ncbi:MAG TPA: tRNA uridine-5-carboxymethylaminomethyl(34) synthesis GTPase MnmE [Alphaproteobacteria bacterium]|nr:tRNA uridine-5-carboxymethylaminomethyl(34) synthesis GTPase MnmE [Alphaproteobacteria bacterium]
MIDTIFALSSAYGKSGVAVIRISGPDLSKIFQKIIGKKNIKNRYAYFVNLKESKDALIDQCVTIYFKSPASFTGEDVIELHTHGSPAVIEKVFELLRGFGMRMAEPGEFSRRAFYNNKMDLTEVDGLAALLDAQTDKQRIAALKSMTGNDSKIYESWRNQMIEISAYAAAILDYDSDDLPKDIDKKLIKQTEKLYNEINSALGRYSTVRAIRKGFSIVLVGPTNVGKSSLFNRLVGSGRAIVSDIPGTTRDVVTSDLDLDGYLVHLSDTAGIRESKDTIEKIGIEKTNEEINNADLIIRIQSSDSKIQSHKPQENEIFVINKSDLNKTNKSDCILVSAKNGDGISDLILAIKSKIKSIVGRKENDLAINERTREHLINAAKELELAISSKSINFDIFSENIRSAADSIGKILGTISATEVADATFSQLCLGK